MLYISGKLKRDFFIKMKPFKEGFDSLKEEEYGFKKDDTVHIHLKEGHHWYDEKDKHVYILRVNYQKIELNRNELEDLIDIQFEYGSYNSCIQNDTPCKNLSGYSLSENKRSKQSSSSSCRISWEVGRGMCSGYEPI